MIIRRQCSLFVTLLVRIRDLFPKRPISSVHIIFSYFVSFLFLVIVSLDTFLFLLFCLVRLDFWILFQWMSFERSIFRKTWNKFWWFVFDKVEFIFILRDNRTICKEQVTFTVCHIIVTFLFLKVNKMVRYLLFICVMCCLCLLCVCYRPFWKHFTFSFFLLICYNLSFLFLIFLLHRLFTY